MDQQKLGEELALLRVERELRLFKRDAKYGKFVFAFYFFLAFIGLFVAGSTYSLESNVGLMASGTLMCIPFFILLAKHK